MKTNLVSQGGLLIATLTHLLSAAKGAETPPLPEAPRGIDHGKELLITDLKVVNSREATYPGPFSFGGVVTGLQSEVPAPVLVRKWLESWLSRQVVNGATVLPRPEVEEKLIRPWQRRDGFDPASGKEWVPMLKNAPFRLLAIVNRLDLAASRSLVALQEKMMQRGTQPPAQPRPELLKMPEGVVGLVSDQPVQPYYGSSELPPLFAAEGRFVFCACGPDGQPLGEGFTVIFEFSLAGSRQYAKIHDWAKAWHALGKHADFNQEYLNDLAALTAEFAEGSQGSPRFVRVRTNEKCFSSVREMREFRLGKEGLTLSPMASTPRSEFANPGTQAHVLLGSLLAVSGRPLLNGSRAFPSALKLQPAMQRMLGYEEAMPLLGGNCLVPESNPAFRWQFNNLADEPLRRRFSLQTCNGCHAGETATADAFHIKPRPATASSEVSTFLKVGTLLSVPGPDGKSVAHYSEMTDRAAILTAFLNPDSHNYSNYLAGIARRRSSLAH